LATNERGVRHLVETGRVHGHKVGGRWRFAKDDLDRCVLSDDR
jgi:excisionase family DNA binding protein